MQERLVYEYAVIRVVPRVEREEFVNVGVIVFCKKMNFLGVAMAMDAGKIRCLYPAADLDCIARNLEAFEAIAAGVVAARSRIAAMDSASRFRWLTAARSTIIQCSKVHPGMATSLEGLPESLLKKMVL